MNLVGVVSISVGIVVVCARGPLLVAPTATVHWFRGKIASKGRVRVLAAIALSLGAVLVWAGASEDSVLATILTAFGLVSIAVSVLGVVFSGAYLNFVNTIVRSDSRASRTAWRFRGLAGVLVGLLLIYYGVHAL